MSEVWCYAFAEDVLSCAVMVRLVEFCNSNAPDILLRFYPGFPENKRGFGHLKKLIPKICNMATANLRTFILTDLDQEPCSQELIRAWFNSAEPRPIPANILFRIAEREVETWLLADRPGIAGYLGIAEANFSNDPDSLEDPKEHLLNVVRSKGRKRFHKEMLPSEMAHVGPEYNPRLCDFVNSQWNVGRAAEKSASLQRAVAAINHFKGM